MEPMFQINHENFNEIVGQDLAEETKIVKFIEGKSSTKIINKIRNINS